MNYYIATDRFGNYDLCHHGILGQKWGVRRYQNKDGSLTPAGKKRYIHDLDKAYRKDKNAKLARIGPNKRLIYPKLAKHDKQQEVLDKIDKELKESKEWKDQEKAWEAYGTPEGRKKFKTPEDEWKYEEKYYSAHAKANNKLYELKQKYYRDLVQAKLKDYTLPDAKEYIDIAEEYMRKKNWNFF